MPKPKARDEAGKLQASAAQRASWAAIGRYSTQLQMQTVFAHVGIGNQWSFASSFFIDCQWLGYAAPLVGGYTYHVSQSGPAADTNVLLHD